MPELTRHCGQVVLPILLPEMRGFPPNTYSKGTNDSSPGIKWLGREARDAQIPRARSTRRLNFVPWRLKTVVAQSETCFVFCLVDLSRTIVL